MNPILSNLYIDAQKEHGSYSANEPTMPVICFVTNATLFTPRVGNVGVADATPSNGALTAVSVAAGGVDAGSDLSLFAPFGVGGSDAPAFTAMRGVIRVVLEASEGAASFTAQSPCDAAHFIADESTRRALESTVAAAAGMGQLLSPELVFLVAASDVVVAEGSPSSPGVYSVDCTFVGGIAFASDAVTHIGEWGVDMRAHPETPYRGTF